MMQMFRTKIFFQVYGCMFQARKYEGGVSFIHCGCFGLTTYYEECFIAFIALCTVTALFDDAAATQTSLAEVEGNILGEPSTRELFFTGPATGRVN